MSKGNKRNKANKVNKENKVNRKNQMMIIMVMEMVVTDQEIRKEGQLVLNKLKKRKKI